MHSFHTPYNVIRWKLVVRGQAEAWSAFERGFPLVVYPGQAAQPDQRPGPVALGSLQSAAAPAAIAAGVRA
jgi:hypothetical protein